MTRAALATLLFATAAHAETGWLSERGRLPEAPRASLFGGFSSAGAGVVLPTSPQRTVAVEAAWDLLNRFAEARVTRAWQLSAARFATFGAAVAFNAFVIPSRPLALGAGAHGSLNLSLGGRTVSFELSLDAGAEGFSAGPSRLPLRLAAGLEVNARPIAIALLSRAGADVIATGAFVVRGEAVLALGYSW